MAGKMVHYLGTGILLKSKLSQERFHGFNRQPKLDGAKGGQKEGLVRGER